ncbi:MAG TPA: ADOP family duplicated permease, partial [Thermoanaerobaculia bacterium]|nr:ADOP family duplicated permease [Thermoanaerobaculia bacterium]
MSQLNQDLRFAFRNLRKQPSLALAAILTLALGIGVNTGIFSIVDSVLLTPPPFREPDRLAIVWGSNPELAKMLAVEDKLPASNALLYDWQKASRSFESLALLQANRMVMTRQGEPQQLGAVSVTGDFFKVLGTSPLLGRTIEPADDNLGSPTVVVLSHNLWQRSFSGDRGVIGKVVTLSNNPFTVIGVLPPRFTFPRGGSEMPAGFGFSPEPDIWVPLALTPEGRQDRGGRGSVVIGRLKPGVDLATAETEIRTITQRFGETYPQTDAGWSARLQPLTEQMLGNLRPALLVLWAAVGLVLLIACANVASLLLARAASRQKEIALRMAMGAGRRRVVSQLLTESALLSLLGGLLGVALAWYGLRAFEAFVPAGLVGAATFSLSLRALAFTAALCLLATVLAGLVPAFQMTRPDLAGSLREGTRAGAGTVGSRRTRSGLVVAEVALAVLLLVGAGLLLRSFVRLLNVDPGFRTEQVLAFELGMPPDRVPPAERIPFLDRVVDQVRTVPGVESVALISDLPMGGNEGFTNFTIEGRPEPTPEEALTQVAALRTVSAGYFEIMEIPLRRGRLLAATDRRETLPVGVIDEALAGTFFPNED